MRSPAASLRLFIALWPPEETRAAIAQWQSQWEWPERAALVPAERLHITLHFLGDVAPQRVRDLRYVLQPVPAPVFDLHFGRADVWQRGIAVLRPEHLPTQLRGLQARIGLALARLGMPVDTRPWRPHVTLARRAAGAKPPPQAPNLFWRAHGGFVLVQTLAAGRGYEILERFGS
jgi:2'-5' RNA ligase